MQQSFINKSKIVYKYLLQNCFAIILYPPQEVSVFERRFLHFLYFYVKLKINSYTSYWCEVNFSLPLCLCVFVYTCTCVYVSNIMIISLLHYFVVLITLFLFFSFFFSLLAVSAKYDLTMSFLVSDTEPFGFFRVICFLEFSWVFLTWCYLINVGIFCCFCLLILIIPCLNN